MPINKNETEFTAMLRAAEEGGGQWCIAGCLDHGTKSAPDVRSARAYVALIQEFDRAGDPAWRCCADMVVDPFGYFDH